MNAIAQVLFSLGFGLLYWEMGEAFDTTDNAAFLGLVAVVAYLAAYFLPQVLFRFKLSDAAPVVLALLSRRFAVATAIVLALNLFMANVMLSAAANPVPMAMELYSATFLGIVLFHGLGGLMAEQANYLQRTKQYVSDQLLLVTVALVVLFVVLALYFLAFDLGVPREPRIYVRDMLFGTLAFLGFGWVIYRLAHH